jgi:PAS domain S-box-containing protein
MTSQQTRRVPAPGPRWRQGVFAPAGRPPDGWLRESTRVRLAWLLTAVIASTLAIVACTSRLLLGFVDAGYLAAGAITASLMAILVGGLVVAFEQRLLSERAHLLEMQAEARGFLDAILDALPIPTLVKDECGRFVVVSERARAVLKRPVEDLLGRTDADIAPPHVAALVAEEDRALLASNEEYRAEVRFATPDGGGKWFEKCKTAVTLGDGSRYIIASTLDIDERKRAEEALRESEAFLQAATWGADVRLWSWQVQPDALHLTDHLKRRLGYDSEELPSTWAALEGLVHPDDRASFASTRQAACVSGFDVCEAEFRLRHRDGHWTWILSRARIERDADGAAVRVIGVHLDITQRKVVEESIRRHRDELEGEVARRTSDLVAARDLAESANRAKSEFLSNMSHELRTPLHAVLSFSQLGRRLTAKGNAPAEKVDRYFTQIAESGARLSGLVESLLDLSTLESRDDTLNRCRNDVVAIARHVMSDSAGQALAKQITLAFEPTCEQLEVVCDPSRIALVVRHLLSNAIKFSGPGSCVTFRLGPVRAADQDADAPLQWRMEVEDEGVGIPENELATVFDRFVQSSKTKSGAGGTGIGLAICNHVVRQHGGRIWAQANPGPGTTFVAVLSQSGSASA